MAIVLYVVDLDHVASHYILVGITYRFVRFDQYQMADIEYQ